MTEEIEQGTAAWFAARCGRVTASKVADVIAKTKTGPSASRATYMGQIIAERLTGTPAESFSNAAMQWGNDKEPDARAAYAWLKGAPVVQVGFVPHPTIEWAGASPDGLVGDDGLVEIKCPNTATHIETLLSGAVPTKYITQMMFQMACTERQWCDFASFDPRLPDDLQLFVRRVPRDEELIGQHEAEITKFLAEVEEKIAALEALR